MKKSAILAVLPSLLVIGIFIYGFIIWTVGMSLTPSTMVPSYSFAGFESYVKLWNSPRWKIASTNLVIFASLFTVLSTIIGLILAILIDQGIRAQSMFRLVFLYPLAISLIVTGNVWRWIFNPDLGIESFVNSLGFAEFTFRWITERSLAIYTIVVAAVWQSSGFVMAMFLAGLRSIDDEVLKAARIDGAGFFATYYRIVVPQLRAVFISVIVILVHLATKTYDLVVAMTRGGPGVSSDLPATFMYEMTFGRDQLAVGAASAVLMMLLILGVMLPYLVREFKNED